MDILFTFAGNHDPYNPEVVKGVFTDGPVLTLLTERSFDAVHIFTTPNSLPNAQQLQREIAKRARDVRTRIYHLDIPDPTDYEALFLNMNARCRKILEAERGELIREFSGLRMIGRSPALTRVMDTVKAAALYDSAVLIQGETETGKELTSMPIHYLNSCPDNYIVTANRYGNLLQFGE